MPAVQETVDQVRRIDVDQYKYGFETLIESEKAPKGFSEDTIRFTRRSTRSVRGPARWNSRRRNSLRRCARRPASSHRSGHAAPRHQCWLFRQREKAQRDFADGAVRTAVAVLDCRASSFDMYNTCAKVDILAQALLKAEEFFT
jgi:hypothetical protein